MTLVENVKSVVWAGDNDGSKTVSITVTNDIKVLFLNKIQRRVTGWSNILVPISPAGFAAIRAIYAEEEIDVNDTIMTDGGVVFARVCRCTVTVASASSVVAAAAPTIISREEMGILDDLCRLVYELYNAA